MTSDLEALAWSLHAAGKSCCAQLAYSIHLSRSEPMSDAPDPTTNDAPSPDVVDLVDPTTADVDVDQTPEPDLDQDGDA